MEKAKQRIKDFQAFHEENYENSEDDMAGLKPDINNLLHMYLPGNITIRETEIIAMVIYEMIRHPNEFVR